MKNYIQVSDNNVPDILRWDVPPQNAGQVVEISYAHQDPRVRTPADEGDAWMKIEDKSVRPGALDRVRYFRRKGVSK